MDKDNQIIIMLKNSISSAFNTSLFLTVTALQYFFFPIVLTYMFWAYAIEKWWQITKFISSEIYSLLQIIPLGVRVWYWAMFCIVQLLFMLKNMEEISITVELEIYARLKVIFTLLHIIPLSHKHASGLYTIVKRIPIFGKGRLPFPNFLFEDTFTSVSFRKGAISMAMPLPEDFLKTGSDAESQTTGSTGGGDDESASSSSAQNTDSESNSTGSADQPASASASESTSTSSPVVPAINEPKPATSTLDKKSSPTKSDEKLAKPTETSTDQSPSTSTSDVKASSSV